MLQTLVRFVREEEGQDFAEYALILGAVGVEAIAVIAQYKTEQAVFALASCRADWHAAGAELCQPDRPPTAGATPDRANL